MGMFPILKITPPYSTGIGNTDLGQHREFMSLNILKDKGAEPWHEHILLAGAALSPSCFHSKPPWWSLLHLSHLQTLPGPLQAEYFTKYSKTEKSEILGQDR